MHFVKTGCTSEISQISGFQNHLPKNLSRTFPYVRANSKNPVCHDGPCSLLILRLIRFSV